MSSAVEEPSEEFDQIESIVPSYPSDNTKCTISTPTHPLSTSNGGPLFSLEAISNSSYYYEMLDTATTKNLTFFTCRHKVGGRLSCLNRLLIKLSQEDRLYNFGRVLYLVMLWKEGVAYINDLNEQEAQDEQKHLQRTSYSILIGKNHLLKWLQEVAQLSVNKVVSKLNNNSLDILDTLAGDEEVVIIDSDDTYD